MNSSRFVPHADALQDVDSRAGAVRRLKFQQRGLESLLVSLSTAVFAMLLVYTYATFSAVSFAYYGYDWNPLWPTLGTGLVCVIILALLLPTSLDRPGDMAIYLLFIIVVVPAMVIPSGNHLVPGDHMIVFQILLSLCMLALILVNRAPRFPLEAHVFSKRGYELFLIALFLILLLPVIAYIGVPTSVPSFGDVYAARTSNREARGNAPGFVAYCTSWLTKVVVPYMIAYGILNRKKFLIVTGLFGTLYLYALAGHKSLVFSILLIITIMLGIRLVGRYLLLVLIPGLTLMIVVTRTLDLFIEVPWFTSLLVNRVLIVPGILTGYYLDFFSSHESAKWAYSFLGRFYDVNYELSPAFLIGAEYFDRPTMQANAHVWADGFANFGYVGMLAVTVILSIIIWIFNCVAIGRNAILVLALTAATTYSLTSTSVFTALVTHGVALMIIVLWLSPAESAEAGIGRSHSG